MKTVLVTCYVNPDLDGVACAVAYAEFLNKTLNSATAGVFGVMHHEAEYLLDRFSISYPKQLDSDKDYSEIILVDSSEINGLQGKISPGNVIEIIDHRKNNDSYLFANAKVQIELVGAAATLIAEKFISNRVDISREAAILLYGAIISNTLNFRGSVTTERDQAAARWLNDRAQLPVNFWEELFLAKSDLSGDKLVNVILSDSAWFDLANRKVSIAQLEIIGVDELIAQRLPEIVAALEEVRKNFMLDIMFLNAIDLKTVKNTFVVIDQETKGLLARALDVRFVGNIGERQDIIMRKQIVPLLKAELEKDY